MGMAPLKSRPPSRNDKDRVTALARTGVMTYARGARVCAMVICPQHSAMQTRIRERASGVIAELLKEKCASTGRGALRISRRQRSGIVLYRYDCTGKNCS